jgi:hypothetical protein
LFEGSGSGHSGNRRASQVGVVPPRIHRDYPARFLHLLGELAILIWKNRGQLPDNFGNAQDSWRVHVGFDSNCDYPLHGLIHTLPSCLDEFSIPLPEYGQDVSHLERR